MKYYYHFANDKLRGGQPIPKIGEWLVHEGKCVLCESGLHASEHPFDALKYAPGHMLHLVELGEIVDSEDGKVVSDRRKIIKSINAEKLLRLFACDCAESVLHLFEKNFPNDKHPHYALKVARDYATGLASRSEMAIAREAAFDTAQATAWHAARAAAWAAALDTALDTAWNAARDAAWHAAWAAAWNAAQDEQRDAFKQIVDKAFFGQE